MNNLLKFVEVPKLTTEQLAAFKKAVEGLGEWIDTVPKDIEDHVELLLWVILTDDEGLTAKLGASLHEEPAGD